jgi:SAM-dependent methyltransferase
MSDYALSSVDSAARARLEALAASMDLGTQGYLDNLGVASGWRCAEIGAGIGSIAAWLADRVGPTGRVLATDLDTRWLQELSRANIEVLRHDIGTESLEGGAFDLVHARFVVAHVPRWRDAIGHVFDAVRPGGWICLEESDWLLSGVGDPPAPAIERFWAAVGQVMTSRGCDPSVGRKIGATFHALGLTEIGGEARAIVRREILGTQLDMLGPMLCESGLLSSVDVDDARTEAAAPGFAYSPLFVAAWGRRPAS